MALLQEGGTGKDGGRGRKGGTKGPTPCFKVKLPIKVISLIWSHLQIPTPLKPTHIVLYMCMEIHVHSTLAKHVHVSDWKAPELLHSSPCSVVYVYNTTCTLYMLFQCSLSAYWCAGGEDDNGEAAETGHHFQFQSAEL